MNTLNRDDYDNGVALVRWWPKDGAWRIALRAPERGPDRYWQPQSFSTRDAAVAAADAVKAREVTT